jgi:phospholipase C
MRKCLSQILVVGMLAGNLINPAVIHAASSTPATPIQHLVVIFQENISFDHYFGTYPNATNPAGQPAFTAVPGTPAVDGLSGSLMSLNPNSLNKTNAAASINPFRLDRSQNLTADQNHNYTPEQAAYHSGLADLFPSQVGVAGTVTTGGTSKGLVMGYYDGNTVTALWNYAQNFAMSDNSYSTNYGPSTPGAINLVSGQTNGVINNANGTGSIVSDGSGGFTMIGDADPVGDICSTSTGEVFGFSGKNVGDLLNASGVSWGFFAGGFDLTVTNPNGSTGCARNTTSSLTNQNKVDYVAHHQPFQYYASTANPKHTRPTSISAIGTNGDAGNHQYDLHDFYDAINNGNFPAVSFLKGIGIQDGHAGYSSPLDEQQFVVQVINFLQNRPEWANTAVVIAYDDSDGWYDHVVPPIVNQSTTSSDALTGTGACGDGTTALPGVLPGTTHAQGRCGFGPRQPLLVVSPWAQQNFVDHTITNQASILRFVEDNWAGGTRIGGGSMDAISNSITNMFNFNGTPSSKKLFLNVATGQPF